MSDIVFCRVWVPVEVNSILQFIMLFNAYIYISDQEILQSRNISVSGTQSIGSWRRIESVKRNMELNEVTMYLAYDSQVSLLFSTEL
jgi:hypothetical protein